MHGFFNYHRLYERKELREIDNCIRRHKQELKKYKSLDYFLGGPESLLYHHGLVFSSESVRNYIKDGIFVDAGGYYGDSALVFLKNLDF